MNLCQLQRGFEFEWWKKQGVDIHTPLSPLPGPDNYYFYIRGPDKELIEINTMGHHRFAHVHLFATDVNETTRWYTEHLGVTPQRPNRYPAPILADDYLRERLREIKLLT